MNCGSAQEWLSRYVDGELAPKERLELVTHLESCTGCRRELVEAERAKAVLASAPVHSMPAALRSRIEAMIDEAEPVPESLLERFRASWSQNPRLALAGAVAAVALLFLSFYVVHQEETTIPLGRLLTEHMVSSRKSVEVHRDILVSAPQFTRMDLQGR